MKVEFDTDMQELLARYHVAQMVLADMKEKGFEERAHYLYKGSQAERARVADKVLLAAAKQAVADPNYCELVIRVAEELTAMVESHDNPKH